MKNFKKKNLDDISNDLNEIMERNVHNKTILDYQDLGCVDNIEVDDNGHIIEDSVIHSSLSVVLGNSELNKQSVIYMNIATEIDAQLKTEMYNRSWLFNLL